MEMPTQESNVARIVQAAIGKEEFNTVRDTARMEALDALQAIRDLPVDATALHTFGASFTSSDSGS